VVDLNKIPHTATVVADGTVLSDQWRPIGILFSARTPGADPIEPVAANWGGSNNDLFFSPDLAGAIAEFEFVEPGTSNPIDIHRFQLSPWFNQGESAQLVGLDEFDAVVAQDDVLNASPGGALMSITGTFRRVEWRTQGDPGIAAGDLQFEVCPPSPVGGCVDAAKASLTISEKKEGNEKLKAQLKGFTVATTQADFGDPVTGDTQYDACIYDDSDELVAGLTVARSGDVCGSKQKDCWKAKKDTGWIYKDPDTSSDGVKSIAAAGGSAGKGALKLQAGNKEKKGQMSLPRGMSEALQGATSARLQVVANDGECFEAVLGTVKRADGVQFKAKTP
jgi:hypothetical protein